MATQRSYIRWTEHGLTHVQETETPMDPEEKVFEQWANANIGVTIEDFCRVNLDDPTNLHLVKPVHLRTQKRMTAMMTRITQLKFNTEFKAYVNVDDKSVLVPVFKEIRGSVATTCTITIPDDFVALFVMAEIGDDAKDKYFLILIDRGDADKEFLSPLLPNVYSDGSLCLGNMHPKDYSLLEQFMAGHRALMENSWNTDLLENNLPTIQAAFQFDVDTKAWIIPPKQVFKAALKPVSHIGFNWIKELI